MVKTDLDEVQYTRQKKMNKKLLNKMLRRDFQRVFSFTAIYSYFSHGSLVFLSISAFDVLLHFLFLFII